MTHSMRAFISILAGLPMLALYVTTLMVIATVVWVVAAVSFFFPQNNHN